MNFQFYIEKLFDSEEFLKFKKENPTAFLCSGFFSIDKKNTSPESQSKADNQQHLDFFIPELNKMFSFKLNQNPIEMTNVENFSKSADEEGKELKPEKISDNFDFDFNELEKVITERMEKEKVKNKVEKILWSLQSKDNQSFLIGTIFLSNLGMLKVTFNLDTKELTNFEKKSFFDFIRIMKKKN